MLQNIFLRFETIRVLISNEYYDLNKLLFIIKYNINKNKFVVFLFI